MKRSITKRPLTSWFAVGNRVQMHPETALWISGARFGDIIVVGRKYVTVKLDALPEPVQVLPANLMFLHA